MLLFPVVMAVLCPFNVIVSYVLQENDRRMLKKVGHPEVIKVLLERLSFCVIRVAIKWKPKSGK